MMGIPLDGPTSLFCHNKSVVKTLTGLESTLKKHHMANTCYRWTREACAVGFVHITHEDGDTNLAKILTNLMPDP